MGVLRGVPGRVVEKAMGVCRFMKLYGQHLPMAFEALFSMSCTVARLEGTFKGISARTSNSSNARISNSGNAGASNSSNARASSSSSDRGSVLYVGRRKNLSYLRHTIFDDCQIVAEKRTNLFAYRKHMDEMAPSVDVLFLDIGWPYHGRINRAGEYLEIPDWVNMAIELPETWEAVVRSFRQTTRNNDLRLIRRNGYRCRPTTSREELADFYDRFYVPFVNHKHAGGPVISPRKHVLKRGAQGALLQVLKDEEVVAAGVVYPEDEVLFFLWMGLPPQYVDSPPEAAISALYFFGIRYAFDHGYKIVDFTGSRAFLDDGAFRFKRKWGARVEDSFSPGSILIRPTRSSRAAARFCQRFPVLARRGGRLEARFLFPDESASEADLARLRKDYDCQGIDRTTVIEISDETETKSMPISGDECQYRRIHTTLDEFAECYVRV